MRFWREHTFSWYQQLKIKRERLKNLVLICQNQSSRWQTYVMLVNHYVMLNGPQTKRLLTVVFVRKSLAYPVVDTTVGTVGTYFAIAVVIIPCPCPLPLDQWESVILATLSYCRDTLILKTEHVHCFIYCFVMNI